MSYSFTVTASSKDEAKEKVKEQIERVVSQQPIHAVDRDAAINATSAFVDLVTIPEGRTIRVSVSGSVGWSGEQAPDVSQTPLNGAGVNISASLA